jgi:hypothetical protein
MKLLPVKTARLQYPTGTEAACRWRGGSSPDECCDEEIFRIFFCEEGSNPTLVMQCVLTIGRVLYSIGNDQQTLESYLCLSDDIINKTKPLKMSTLIMGFLD